MGKSNKPVHAEYGTWKYVIRNGEPVEFIGSFSLSDDSHAFGTSRFLHNAWISNTKTERPPEAYSDGYVVRLRKKDGDRMEKFVDFAQEHNLMPGLQEALDEARARIADERQKDTWMAEHRRKERSALAFKPLAESYAADLISRAHWEMVEAGYPKPLAPNSNKALVMATDHPQLAFQVAFYLHKHGPGGSTGDPYIDNRTFFRLNREIRRQLANPEPDHEFRVVIKGAYINAFEADFPDAGRLPSRDDPDSKKPLGAASLRRLEELSDPEHVSKTR